MKTLSFLQNILGALHYFTYPWVLLLVIGLLLFYFFYGLGLKKLTDITVLQLKPNEAMGGSGCLTQFLSLFVQAFFVTFFLLLLLPILMGVRTDLSWQEVEPLGFVAIRSGLLAMILVTILSFMPWIGTILAASPGLEFFTLSVLTYRFMTPLYLEAHLKQETNIPLVYPSYLKLGLYFIFTLVLTGLIRWAISKTIRTPLILWNADLLGGLGMFFLVAFEISQRTRSFLS